MEDHSNQSIQQGIQNKNNSSSSSSHRLREKNCNIHSDKKAVYFCLDHQCNKKGPICDKCATIIHQEHESIFTIDDICNFLDDQVQENIQCPEKEDQQFEAIHKSITEKLDSIQLHIEQFENYVIAKMKYLKAKIVNEKKLLQEKLDDIFEFRELFKKNNSELIVNVLQGIDVSQMQRQVRDKKNNAENCKKFLNTNNQKLHIKDFRVSEPSFLKSLILKKFSIQTKKISNQCMTLLDKIFQETTCQFQQKNPYQFKKMPNKYLEEKYLPQLKQKNNSSQQMKLNGIQKSKSCEQDYDSCSSQSSTSSQVIEMEQPHSSLTEILKSIEENNGDEFGTFNTFLVDKTCIGDKINVTNGDRVLEQKGVIQRFAFLFPQFSKIDDNKKLFHAKIRILNYKNWITVGIANKAALQSQGLKYVEGQQAYLLSMNGYVYQNREEPVKEFLQPLDISSGDIISLLFYFTSPCKSESCLEIWLNNKVLLKTFKGNLFEKHEFQNISFCIGLLKGDSIEIIAD